MIAYNRPALDNSEIQQEAAEALGQSVITRAEYDKIAEAYPFTLYTPNFFIRIGLFLLTVLAVACGLGLFMLMTMGAGERGMGFVIIFWGIASYGALEFFIHARKVYKAGVDDALLWLAGGLIFGGVILLFNNISPGVESVIVLVLAAWGVVRYTDKVMALVAYGASINLMFHLLISYDALLPFVIMAFSVLAYFLFTRLSKAVSLRHYYSCLSLLRMAALAIFYLSGNYYVVQNINASLRGEATPVALSWLWWTFTSVVPVAYIFLAIRKKDPILLWAGLGLVAAAVFTIRYYYHILPAELAMIIGGSILIVGAYGLIRYLHTQKHGFTSMASDEPHPLENLPVESLILAETFKTAAAQPSDQNNGFGGGSGGGAGAGGTY
jgi:hypothetical protein